MLRTFRDDSGGRNLVIALDGNAIGGDLLDVFGADLTAAVSVCATCGASSYVAECVVYLGGPGRVARCHACGDVHIVLVTIRGVTCVDLRGISRMDRS